MNLGLNLDGYEFDMVTSNNDPDRLINYDIPDEVGSSLLFSVWPTNPIGFYGHPVTIGNLTNLDLISVLGQIPNLEITSREPDIKVRELTDGALT